MPTQIITTDDLREFKTEIMDHLTELITTHVKIIPDQKRYLKSSEVMSLLDMSPSTLQNLRITRALTYSKIGGTIYYDWEEIVRLMEKNKKAAKLSK